ncbi:NACHT domain-containing protein [Kitasatospora sp. NPDC092948]|uniref:NACHT domain-containing protein n=1 Tax=Kitasatospora sp. NPDC092948 TaxID=3364088 RepID=UPI0038018D50
MVPRAGGETDKFGLRYEGAWTVRHALYVLLGMGTSITLEPGPSLGDGIEFVYRLDGATQVHQVKRQNRNANSWNVASLRDKEIWSNLRSHVDSGRAFHFISTVPARAIDELTDRARRSDDFATFEAEWLTDGLRGPFSALAGTDIYGSAATAWRMLRGLWIEWHNERDVVDINAVLAEQILAGAPGRLAATGLGDLLLNNLGTTLDAQTITARLGQYGLRLVSRSDNTEVTSAVGLTTHQWARTVERGLLKPVIPRDEADRLVAQVMDDARQLIVLTGGAGSGKSSVVHQAFEAFTRQGTPVLAFRLDRIDPFKSTTELGQCIGLPISPVGALGTVAAGRPCVLIVDQLDAVSMASGRIPENFDAVAELVDEATVHPAMRVVLVCREFDAEADPRIRSLTASDRSSHLPVSALSDAQIDTALTGMGLDISRITPSQRALLRRPLHLVLLTHVANQQGALATFTSTRQLFDGFWETKRQLCTHRKQSVRFHEAIATVVAAMSSRQRLSAPESVLDTDDLAMSKDVLLSEQIFVHDGRQLAFFHESFFDYAFARDWLRRDETLAGFLTGGEQELFRRGQVRQVLDHLRDQDPERFAEEIEALLSSPGVRYHIKEVVLAVLRGLENPTSREWAAVAGVLKSRPAFHDQLVDAVTNTAWFRRADDEGAVDAWLTSADTRERDWAIRLMASAADTLQERVGQLLESHTAHPQFGTWLIRILRFARLSGSRLLFELVRDAARTSLLTADDDILWMSALDLAAERPAWAVELIGALVAECRDALRLDDHGRLAVLTLRDHDALEAVTTSARDAPEEFCARMLPVLLNAMSTTALPQMPGGPLYDSHFSFRSFLDQPGDLGEALYRGAATALRIVAIDNPDRVRELVSDLADAPYHSANRLLYQALSAAGPALASWSARILLEGPHRFFVGYVSNVSWAARELILAIGDALPDETFAELEAAIIHLRLPTDGTLSPWHEFTLLTALPEERLSERARRRLGELRRQHGNRQQPEAPRTATVHAVTSPIPLQAAHRMSDDQWLAAMKKHSQDRIDWSTGSGGPRELSHVLRNMTQTNPRRFARLALRIDAAAHPAYGAAILLGLGHAEPHDDPEEVFATVRHFARMARVDHDRWLGWAFRKYLTSVPLDLVEVLLDRALSSGHPAVTDREVQEVTDKDLLTVGINTARGSAAESLADTLVHDPGGSRAALVIPHLNRLAADPSPAVRVCVANVLHAVVHHDRTAAEQAFEVLVRAPDSLLAAGPVFRLFLTLCHGDVRAGGPVIERMLHSPVPEVRRAGGRAAALAAMEWETTDLLAAVLAENDGAQLQGAADVCAQRLLNTGNAALAHHALVQFFHHPEKEVREAAAAVAAALRGHRLGPVHRTLTALIESRAFEAAPTQLLITLREAPDRVDDLILGCVRRFLKVFGAASSDLRTREAAGARHVGRLLVRSHAQATSPAHRSEILDLLDQLLLLGTYGVSEAVASADRD